MNTKKTFFTLLLTAVICAPASLSAQITIGSGRAPSPWSLLDLCTHEQQKALHNARMDSIQRNTLMHPDSLFETRQEARGLMLFNTDNNCLEYWNGTQWISLCAGDTPDPCRGFAEMDTRFCFNPNPAMPQPNIADLTARAIAAGGNGTVRWFDAPTYGNELHPNHPLSDGARFYADNCVGTDARIPVTVSFPPDLDCILNARLTAFVNVMYDFQHQRLEAYSFPDAPSGGEATSWQWQVSTDGINWQNIANATSATWTIPAYFMYRTNYTGVVRGAGNNQNPLAVDFNSRELFFRCLLSNHVSTIPTNTVAIYFIRTNTSGFGIDTNNVRYLTLNRAKDMGTGPDNIKIALLNLGQSGTGAWRNGVRVDIGTPQDDRGNLNDAGDLGDFYQWGRVADGHQHVAWSKHPISRVNLINPFDGGSATSRPVFRGISDLAFNYYGQVTDPAFVGNFITTIYETPSNIYSWPGREWNTGIPGIGYPGTFDLWGNNAIQHAATSRAGVPTSLDGINPWTSRARANNPCPPGWRVPSIFDFADMHESDGFDTRSEANAAVSGTNGNTWTYRPIQVDNDTYGGMIITNDTTGESVFLPNAYRRQTTGEYRLHRNDVLAIYWSSTSTNHGNGAWVLAFRNSNVIANVWTFYSAHSSNGLSVRCVQ